MNAITPTEKKSPVVIVEDHPVLCDGLKQLINSQPDLVCVGVADDISGAKRLVEECKPDLMVLDLRLKGGDAPRLYQNVAGRMSSSKGARPLAIR